MFVVFCTGLMEVSLTQNNMVCVCRVAGVCEELLGVGFTDVGAARKGGWGNGVIQFL